jgi:hypothetical protein
MKYIHINDVKFVATRERNWLLLRFDIANSCGDAQAIGCPKTSGFIPMMSKLSSSEQSIASFFEFSTYASRIDPRLAVPKADGPALGARVLRYHEILTVFYRRYCLLISESITNFLLTGKALT